MSPVVFDLQTYYNRRKAFATFFHLIIIKKGLEGGWGFSTACAAGSGCSEEAQCLHLSAGMNAALEALPLELKSLIHNDFLTL